MKNLFKKSFMLFCLCFIFVACEENPVIENAQSKEIQGNQNNSEIRNLDWVIKNQSQISTMTRGEIAQLNGNLQREIYRFLSPEKRKSLWMDKMEHLKTIVKSPEEIDFINQMEEIIVDLSFDKILNEQDMAYYENMLTKAMKEFNWSRTFVIYAFGTLHDMNKKLTQKNDFFGMNETEAGGVIDGFANRVAQQTPPPDCNCNWGWCPGSSCDDDAGCDETTVGCSFLLLGPCDGKCE